MKVRDIGKKIGDLEVNMPSEKSKSKFIIMFLILYRISYWGIILFGIVMMIGNLMTEGYYPVEKLTEIGVICIIIPIVADLILKFIVNTYKNNTADL